MTEWEETYLNENEEAKTDIKLSAGSSQATVVPQEKAQSSFSG